MCSSLRIFDRPVKAIAEVGRELHDIGLYEAAVGTYREREESNASLCDVSPATQTIVIASQVTLGEENRQFSGIGPDIVLSQGLFIDIREFGLRRRRSGTLQEAMPDSSPTETSGHFDSRSLNAHLFCEEGAFAFTLRCDEILKVKIEIEDKTIHQPLVER
jgi:hypothetical protein